MVIDLHAMVTFWGRALGFVLLFVGTLVYVAVASPTGGCLTDPTCLSNFPSNAANAILAGKILWCLGLFFLGAAAGLKLHWKLGPSPGASPEQMAWIRTDRWINVALVFLSVILLFVLLLWPTIVGTGGTFF